MNRQLSTRLSRLTAAFLTFAFASPVAIADEPQPTAIVRAFRNDAELHDIAFVDQSIGWAVGDRGTIWHTDDGGTNWRLQPSPVSCTLNAVCFIDAHRGWAAGGHSQPGQNATRGVILRTEDGGATWRHLPQPLLPQLAGIKFFDPHHGIAFGVAASFAPSGVFVTRDGGDSWQPLPADAAGSWLAGDFLEPGAGAVAGPAGRVATLVRGKISASPLAATSLRSIRAMQLAAPTTGWAVGDGGLLLATADLGRSWQTPPAIPLQTSTSSVESRPGESLTHFDFYSVAVQGTNVWVVGSPGTQIFHSPDNGQTWHAAPTGQTAPLRAIRFIDAQHGWAAGALGNILATTDGGRTWHIQRAGARRAALLAIFPNATDVPLELLADAGAADGYITAVSILCHQTPGEPASSGLSMSKAAGGPVSAHRAHEALLLAGAAAATTAWRFPLPPVDLALTPDDHFQALNRENDGRALEQIQRHLVRELRMWRPDVVVIPYSTASDAPPIAALLDRLMPQCVAAAADPDQHPELTTEAGLSAWQVKKVYGLTSPGARGEETIETAHFSPWLGATLADFAAPARGLLVADHSPPLSSWEFKQLFAVPLPVSGKGQPRAPARGIFAGIHLPHGSEARRPQPDHPVNDIETLRRLAARRRMLQQILARTQGNAAWSAQVGELIEGLSPHDAGQLLAQLAEGYRKSGRLDLAADTYFLLARRTPDHPLADPALAWLVHFYAGSEVAHCLASRAATNLRHDNNLAMSGEVASSGPSTKASTGTATSVQQAAAVAPIPGAPPAISLSPDDRRRRAAQLTDYLKTARPSLYAEPSLRFAETAAQRALGYANPAKRLFIAMRGLPETDPWRECAAAEEWLEKPGDAPPAKKLAACRRTQDRPILDGQLNDPLWHTADRLPFGPELTAEGRLSDKDSRPRSGEGLGEGKSGPNIRLTHDNEFLYLAIHCPKAANVVYPIDGSPRPRDANLTAHDRVSIHIDTDRDFTTAFELTVDSRGWTHDACWGDATWNPTWYVAAAGDETSWTIEAAIPLAELSEKPPAARDVWAVAARRTIPRTGYQTWSGPTTSEPTPAHFGLLIFE